MNKPDFEKMDDELRSVSIQSASDRIVTLADAKRIDRMAYDAGLERAADIANDHGDPYDQTHEYSEGYQDAAKEIMTAIRAEKS